MIIKKNNEVMDNKEKKIKGKDKKIYKYLNKIVTVIFNLAAGFIIIAATGAIISELIVRHDRNKSDYYIVMDELINLDYYDYRNDTNMEHGELKNFDISKNLISFRNFETINNSGGVCAGINLFEKFNYMNKLSDINSKLEGNINLEDLKISNDEEFKSIYPTSLTMKEKLFIDPSIKAGNRNSEYISKYYADDLPIQDFNSKIKDSEKAEVLNAINVLSMKQNEYKKKIFLSNRPSNGIELLITQISSIGDKEERKVNLEYIKDMINNDEPVVIGLHMPKDGHALLGYKYEYIDSNTVKLYVSDSNLPFLDAKTEAEESFNEDLKNNTFILFNREDEKSDWNYIYNPRLNGSYFYFGKYNSFVQGSSMSIL